MGCATVADYPTKASPGYNVLKDNHKWMTMKLCYTYVLKSEMQYFVNVETYVGESNINRNFSTFLFTALKELKIHCFSTWYLLLETHFSIEVFSLSYCKMKQSEANCAS